VLNFTSSLGSKGVIVVAISQTSVHSGPAKRLFLVDGMSHIFRAFYAIRNLSNSQGLPTNAIYGFASMLRKLMRQYRPDYMAVVFDGQQPTFRHDVFQDYKANRTEMPDGLAAQLPYIRKLCVALNVPVLEKERYEADDIIGTLAKRAERENLQAVIVSNDKDMFQLVTDKVHVLHQSKEDVLFDPSKVKEFFGVPPGQVIDVLGLMGDSVDNVPGAPGIGEKGARELINRFGSLDNLLANREQVERKAYREALQNHYDQILQSKQLVTIDTHVPLECDWEKLKCCPPNDDGLQTLFTELGFQTLLKELEAERTPRARAESSAKFRRLTNRREAQQLIKDLQKQSAVFCHLDLDSKEPMQARVRALALAGADATQAASSGWLVPFEMNPEVALGDFGEFWEDPKIHKVFHNAKCAHIVLRRQGLSLQGVKWDTFLMSYLVYPNRSNHNFEEIAFALLEKTPSAEPGHRCAITRELFAALEPKLQELQLEKVYREIELPLAEVLAEMEWNGIRIDSAALRRMSKEFERKINDLTQKIYELAGAEFNLNSPRQLGEILFEKLNLPAPRRLKKSGQYSTSVEILEQLAYGFELPRLILEYRQIAKLKSGYVDTLPKLVNPETGRVHTSFNQTVAATGRLSSSNPNLQNIPIRTESGMAVRSAFIPSQGCVLMGADYSQIELRILAHLSGDAVLVDSFRKGEDIHTRTAAEVFGIPADKQTGEIRRRAKVINFGIIYGQTAFGLAKQLGTSNRDAQQYINRYFERYQGVKQYLQEIILETRKTQLTRTLFGRLRQIPDIDNRNPNLRNIAERVAVNSPIQGTAADLIKRAMIQIHRKLKEQELQTKMLLQVHDELVFDVPENEVEVVHKLVKTEMETVYELSVPIKVDIGTGRNWMET
jgi:DNA polymerase-1